MTDTKTHYYVHVIEPSGDDYDVGPFEESGHGFTYGKAAIDYLYRQIGLLKTAYPEDKLIKHMWHYKEAKDAFANPLVEIDVEIAKYRLSIKSLNPPAYKNVIDEIIERKCQE